MGLFARGRGGSSVHPRSAVQHGDILSATEESRVHDNEPTDRPAASCARGVLALPVLVLFTMATRAGDNEVGRAGAFAVQPAGGYVLVAFVVVACALAAVVEV